MVRLNVFYHISVFGLPRTVPATSPRIISPLSKNGGVRTRKTNRYRDFSLFVVHVTCSSCFVYNDRFYLELLNTMVLIYAFVALQVGVVK